tara:strand:+ start:468 stop:983 length:516 start_codon:yes stop_codon:yes gene_type:complete
MADFVFDKFKEFLGGAVAVSGTPGPQTLEWADVLSNTGTFHCVLIVGDMFAVGSIVQAVDEAAALASASVSEYVGTGYVRKAVTGKTVATTTPAVVFNGNPSSAWSSLGAASANCDGMMVVFVPLPASSLATDNVPLFYFDFKNATPTNLAFNGNGGNVTITFSNGMVTLT